MWSRIARNAFDDNGKCAGFVCSARLVQHDVAFGFGAALGAEATIDIHRLRAQADMTHDRDASGQDTLDRLAHFGAALQFHGVRA